MGLSQEAGGLVLFTWEQKLMKMSCLLHKVVNPGMIQTQGIIMLGISETLMMRREEGSLESEKLLSKSMLS